MSGFAGNRAGVDLPAARPTASPADGSAGTVPATAGPAGASGRSAGTGRAAGRVRPLVVFGGLVVAVPVVLVLAVSLGAVPVPVEQVWSIVLSRLTGAPVTVSPIDEQIVWEVRAPRVLLAFVVGAGLAVAGTVLQAVVRNPLADPYVLGVSSGASLAAVWLITVVGIGAAGADGTGPVAALGVSGAAFVGGLLTLAAVVLLSRGRHGGALDPTRLLLAGVALSYLFQALTSWLQLRSDPAKLSAVLFWLLGTVAGAAWSSLGLPAAVVLVSTLWLIGRRRALNALMLGDETATSLGIDVGRLRLQVLAVAAALTAAVIAVAGGVGFVGLVAPHCVRLLLGADHRRVLPAAALLGGVFLVAADLAGRLAAQPLELPLSVVTALAGVPFFLFLLRRSGRGPATLQGA